jgi:hypothetical protein
MRIAIPSVLIFDFICLIIDSFTSFVLILYIVYFLHYNGYLVTETFSGTDFILFNETHLSGANFARELGDFAKVISFLFSLVRRDK